MKLELNEVTTMSKRKVLSTYEREMKNPAFNKAFKESYKKLLFSELLIALMDDDDKSVRKLAEEAKLSQLLKVYELISWLHLSVRSTSAGISILPVMKITGSKGCFIGTPILALAGCE